MALLRDYLARKLLDENHPTREEGRCLNHLRGEGTCSVCREVCPRGVFGGEDPDWTLCDGCGACWCACPTRALRPAALMAGSILETCSRARGDVVLACSQWAGEASLKLPCLAAFPWELCAFFALDGRVGLTCGDCAHCPQEPLLRRWRENELPRVRAFLGEELGGRVIFGGDGAPAAAGVSRREAFSMIFSKSKATLGSLLPASGDLTPDGTLCRQLLAHRLRQMEEPSVCRYELPRFGAGCTGCGLCARMCPGKALHRVDGEETGEKKVWYMAVIPWRCTGCGLCERVCPGGGLEGLAVCETSEPTRPVVYPVEARPCPRCGEPMGPEEEKLCARCLGEAGREIVW